jgi:hypothetical protein
VIATMRVDWQKGHPGVGADTCPSTAAKILGKHREGYHTAGVRRRTVVRTVPASERAIDAREIPVLHTSSLGIELAQVRRHGLVF